MKQLFLILIVLIIPKERIFLQELKYFSLLPDVGAVRNQSAFYAVASDSNYIYTFGDRVIREDSNRRNKVIEYIVCVFDYSGKLLSIKSIIDTSIQRLVIYGDVFKIKRQKEAVFDLIYYEFPSTINPLGSMRYGRLNVFNGNIDSFAIIPWAYPGNKDVFQESRNEITWVNDTLLTSLKVHGGGINELYIFEIDRSFNLVKWLKIENTKKDTSESIRWVTKDSLGNYEVITQELFLNNIISSTKYYSISYNKYDPNGLKVKKQIINTFGKNIGINGGGTFNVKRNDYNQFVIFGEEQDTLTYKSIVPVVVYTSPEGDTLYKLTPMYAKPASGTNQVDHFSYYLEKLGNNRGYIASAVIETNLFAEPDYGALFKVSSTGDSVWLRKFQPIGWDSTRARWMKFTMVKETPYQSLVVSAQVADGDENVLKSWILHLDKDGCLIPGCYTSTNTNLSNKNEATPFEVYPNPISGHLLYLLSRVTAKLCRISICDLSGNILETKSLSIEKDVQYLLDTPEKLPNGQYLIKLEIKGQVFTKPIQILR